MDRRDFLHTAGLGTAVTLIGARTTVTVAAEPKAAPVKRLPARSEVPVGDTWDLSSLFAEWQRLHGSALSGFSTTCRTSRASAGSPNDAGPASSTKSPTHGFGWSVV